MINKIKCFFGLHSWKVSLIPGVMTKDAFIIHKVYDVNNEMFESRCTRCNKQRW